MLLSIEPKSGRRRDRVIAPNMALVTLISLAHIGNYGLIVSHRAILGNKDAKINVYPVTLQNSP
jgi:hypothetical protein